MLAALAKLPGLALTVLAKFALDWFAALRRERDQSMKDLGAAEANAAANKEASDAEARMADANAQPHDRRGAAERLQSGTG